MSDIPPPKHEPWETRNFAKPEGLWYLRHADVLTTYDWHGGYGHPDHIQVHRVGARVAELMPNLRVLQATMNRTRMVEMMKGAIESGEFPQPLDVGDDFDPEGPADDGNPFGMAVLSRHAFVAPPTVGTIEASLSW